MSRRTNRNRKPFLIEDANGNWHANPEWVKDDYSGSEKGKASAEAEAAGDADASLPKRRKAPLWPIFSGVYILLCVVGIPLYQPCTVLEYGLLLVWAAVLVFPCTLMFFALGTMCWLVAKYSVLSYVHLWRDRNYKTAGIVTGVLLVLISIFAVPTVKRGLTPASVLCDECMARHSEYVTPRRTGAICDDGWRSHATGRGACSHHGGVARWLYATVPGKSREECMRTAKRQSWID